MKKHTYEYVLNYFKENDCELISKEYKNNGTKLEYICSCGNKSNISFRHFKSGHRCMKCSGTEKLTLEFVSNYFKQNDCELISKEYKNNSEKLEYICSCGNKSSIIFHSFRRGHRCAKCAGTEKLTFEFVSNYFKEQKCKLLETEYINTRTKMDYICLCGNKSSIIFHSFQMGHRCAKCAGTERLTFEFVSNYFKENDCELLETEYKNANPKLRYICSCGNESSIIYNSFKNGTRCNICGTQRASDKHRLTFDFVLNYFKENDCELLETEYINSKTKIKYICSCNNESITTFSSFRKGTRCAKCAGNEQLTFDFVSNYFKEQKCKLLETEYINTLTKMQYICLCGNKSSTIFSSFQNGVRCRGCSINRTTKILHKWLKDKFISVKIEEKFDWCKYINHLPYDFLLEDYKIIIELDGRQHFEDIPAWNSIAMDRIKNDKFKMICALRKGYKVIRIYQPDVLFDKLDWKATIQAAIEQKTNWRLLYISSDPNIYNKHSISKLEFHLLTQIYKI